MRYVLTPKEMRAADTYAMEEIGIPSSILMENAARSAAGDIRSLCEATGYKTPVVYIFCGSGNNGGDGFAIARHLAEWGEIHVFWIGNTERMTPETHTNFDLLPRLDIPVQHLNSEEDLAAIGGAADCIVDAMLGIGGNESPRGMILKVLQHIQSAKAFRIAIDVPTGFNAETGIAASECFCADVTVTMAAAKIGMYLNQGPEVCGELRVAPIGIPARILPIISRIGVLEADDVREWLPRRKARTSKFDYGRVAVIGGSHSMPGAIALSANAAVAAGAGLVKLYTPAVHPAVIPEVMVHTLSATKNGTIAKSNETLLRNAIKESSVIVVGPGLGTDSTTVQMIGDLIHAVPQEKTVVVDADALRALNAPDTLGRHIIVTPHLGEFARLTDEVRATLYPRTFTAAREWAAERNCVIVLKDVPVIISDGKQSYLNVNGNAGMATPGSGDVLSGVIGALAAQKVEPLRAAALGVFLHGAAGDWYAARYNQETLQASAISSSLRHVF